LAALIAIGAFDMIVLCNLLPPHPSIFRRHYLFDEADSVGFLRV
jgi:hypothetical protein